MAKPIVLNTTETAHTVIEDDVKLDASSIPVSAEQPNGLSVETDGLRVNPADLVSATQGNGLTTGVDGKLTVNAIDVSDIITDETDNILQLDGTGEKLQVQRPLSTEARNLARLGNDAKIFVGANDLISDQAGNTLVVSAIDDRLYVANGGGGGGGSGEISTDTCNLLDLGTDQLPRLLGANAISTDTDNKLSVVNCKLKVAPSDLISSDSGNGISLGGDGGLTVNVSSVIDGIVDDIISTDSQNTIVKGSDNKLFSAPVTAGDNSITVDGSAISARRATNGGISLSASGMAVDTSALLSTTDNNKLILDNDKFYVSPYTAGDSSISIVGDMVSVRRKPSGGIVTDTTGVYVDLDALISDASGNVIRNDGGLVVSVAASDPLLSLNGSGDIMSELSVTYDDVSGVLSVFGRSSTTPISTVTISSSTSVLKDAQLVTNPEGQPEGTYILFVLELSDGSEQNLYLNVTELFTIYTAADDSIVISNETIGVKRKSGGGVGLDTDGVYVEASEIVSDAGANDISVSNGKLLSTPYVSSSSAITITDKQIDLLLASGGGLAVGGDGLFIDRAGGNIALATRSILAGAGLTGGGNLTADRTIAADIATTGNITAGTAGKMVDAAGLVAAFPALASALSPTSRLRISSQRSSGTFVAPTNIVSDIALFFITGGGGSGAFVINSTSTTTAMRIPSGGGGAATVFGYFSPTPGASYPITVGAGGAAVGPTGTTANTVTLGNAGGYSEFCGLRAYGGAAGIFSEYDVGYSVQGGNIDITSPTNGATPVLAMRGGPSGFGSRSSSNNAGIAVGGNGGASFWGDGGWMHIYPETTTATVLNNYKNGSAPGSGGAGRGRMYDAAMEAAVNASGAGASGVVSIIYLIK